jgi:hypothetical protein
MSSNTSGKGRGSAKLILATLVAGVGKTSEKEGLSSVVEEVGVPRTSFRSEVALLATCFSREANRFSFDIEGIVSSDGLGVEIVAETFVAKTPETVYTTPTKIIINATMLKNPKDFFCLLLCIIIKD